MLKVENYSSLTIAFILVLFVLNALPVMTAQQKESSSQEITWAERFYERGNYNAAVDILMEFLKNNGDRRAQFLEDFGKAYLMLARIYFEAEEFPKMNLHLENLLKLKPDFKFNSNEDGKFIKYAESVRKKIPAVQVIVVSFTIQNANGQIRVGINTNKPENLQNFADAKNIRIKLTETGDYYFFFSQGNRTAELTKTIQKDIHYYVFLND